MSDRRFVLQRLLDRTVQSISEHYPNKLPDWRDLAALQLGWGNFGFMASTRYLRKVVAAAHGTQGPILECGSGLTTLIMGMLTRDRGIELFSLEHHPVWHKKMQWTLEHYGLDHVHVLHAPLKDFGEYDWYGVDKSLIPGGIELVVCDGPPGNIKGSRYGLIPEMEAHLAQTCTILLDDANRSNEQRVMESWRSRHGFDYRMEGMVQKFAMVNRIVT
jgi:hypothetical protein